MLDTEEAGEGHGLLVDRRKVWNEHWLAGNIPGWTAQSFEQCPVPAALPVRHRTPVLQQRGPSRAPPAGRGEARQVGKENVYEYEPAGVGSCESPTGACVSLISSGTSDRESAFLEATPSGDDVFFLTAAQLLPQDTDTAFDIYDARVCSTQSPCLPSRQSSSGGCESAETCRPAAPAQQAPIAPTGTATSSGPGNTTAQPNAGKIGLKASKSKQLTRAQKLARALQVCKKLKSNEKRQVCIRRAHKAYGARHAASKARRTRRGSRR